MTNTTLGFVAWSLSLIAAGFASYGITVWNLVLRGMPVGVARTYSVFVAVTIVGAWLALGDVLGFY